MKFGLVLFAITLLLQPVGQILEKKGMAQIGQITSISSLVNLHTIWKLATNPYVVAGVLCSAAGLFLWLGALSSMKVSYLYPLGGVSYIVLAVLAHLILKEPITLTNWAGIGVIVIGAFLLNK